MNANTVHTDMPADRLRPMNQVDTTRGGEEQTVVSELTHQANSLFRGSLYPPTTTATTATDKANKKQGSSDMAPKINENDHPYQMTGVLLVDKRDATRNSAGNESDHLDKTNSDKVVVGAIAVDSPSNPDDLLLSKQTAALQSYSNRDERLLREQEKALGVGNNRKASSEGVTIGAIAVDNPSGPDARLLSKQTTELHSYASGDEGLLLRQEKELAKHDAPLSSEDRLLSKQTAELQQHANGDVSLLRKQEEDLAKHANRGERPVAANPVANDSVNALLNDLGVLPPATQPGAVAVHSTSQPRSDDQSGGAPRRTKRQAEASSALNASMTAPPRNSSQAEAKALVDDLNANLGNDNSSSPFPLPGAYARDGPGATEAASPSLSPSIDFQGNEDVEEPSPLVFSASAGDYSAANDPSTSEGLAEARPVGEEEQDAENQLGGPAQTAKLVDTKEMERKATEATQKDRRCRLFALVAIVCSIAIFAIIFGVSTKQDNGKKEEGDGAVDDMVLIISSDQPSAAPTRVLDKLLMDLPTATIARMNSGSHMPQWKAWNWLSNHQNLVDLPEWRRQQLFGLATVFFALGGEEWPSFISERWLDDSEDECLWFSSGHGYFRDGEYELWKDCTGSYCKGTQEPCNENGEFTKLILWDLELEGLSPSIPPEIALLTSLSALSLAENDINATLPALLPQEIYQLANLTDLVLIRNNLRGPIPSEIDGLTSLTRLDIYKNDLSGQLPSEIGLMTQLDYFSAGRTDVTGQIPSELGLLTVLTHLHLHRNQMTGLVPSELGLLTAMENLYLYTNSFSGSLPTELGSWEKARIFRVNGNNFTGPIPNEFGGLTSLERMELSINRLSSTIPNEVGSISSLKVLQLHNNRLTGSVPEALNETVSMSLDGNQLTGAVPYHLCSVLWCDCSSSVSFASTCEMLGDPPEWPGRYPQGSEDQEEMYFALNIHTDKDPSETEWYWQEETNVTGIFQTVLDSGGRLELGHYLNSFILPGAPNKTYKLGVTDRWGDGLWAGGWITLTTANQTVACASEMNPSFSEVTCVFEVAPDGSVQETPLA